MCILGVIIYWEHHLVYLKLIYNIDLVNQIIMRYFDPLQDI